MPFGRRILCVLFRAIRKMLGQILRQQEQIVMELKDLQDKAAKLEADLGLVTGVVTKLGPDVNAAKTSMDALVAANAALRNQIAQIPTNGSAPDPAVMQAISDSLDRSDAAAQATSGSLDSLATTLEQTITADAPPS